MSIKCGNCHEKHDSVADVRRCHEGGLSYNEDLARSLDDDGNRPTDPQWRFYRDLCRQLGKHIPPDRERNLFTFESISGIIDSLRRERDAQRAREKGSWSQDGYAVPAKAVAPSQVQKAAYPEVGEGRYAIPSLTGNNDLDFFKVDRPTEGKWAGYTFVNRVIGGKPDAPIRAKDQKVRILYAIKEFGVERSRTLFGQEIGRCWMCGRHLTDETSRNLGIGPDCRSK